MKKKNEGKLVQADRCSIHSLENGNLAIFSQFYAVFLVHTMQGKTMKKVLMGLAAAAILAGCAAIGSFGPPPKDGELAMPSDYRTWPVYLSGIEKETGHVRDIYINPTGYAVKKGDSFPNGSVSVMEIYKATPGTDGKMVKGALEKVFMMAKGKDWGTGAPEGLRTGDWVYASFEPNGQPAKADYTSCRACHVPLADKDFLFHYDRYFELRESGGAPSHVQWLEKHGAVMALTAQEAEQAANLLR